MFTLLVGGTADRLAASSAAVAALSLEDMHEHRVATGQLLEVCAALPYVAIVHALLVCAAGPDKRRNAWLQVSVGAGGDAVDGGGEGKLTYGVTLKRGA